MINTQNGTVPFTTLLTIIIKVTFNHGQRGYF